MMVLFLMPLECILNPQAGQKCAEGAVSSVRYFLLPWIETLEMVTLESSKSSNSVILFIYPPFKMSSLGKNIIKKEGGKDNSSSKEKGTPSTIVDSVLFD